MLRRTALLGTLAVALAACGGGSDSPAVTAPTATAPSSDAHSSAHAAARGVRLVSVGDFEQPLYVTAPPGDRRRIFVVGQDGRIWGVRGGKRLAQPVLHLPRQVRAG